MLGQIGFGSATGKFDAVQNAVDAAKEVIETAVLPPNPLGGLKTKKGVDLLMYRKELEEQALEREQKGVEAPPPWGLKINLANMCIGKRNAEDLSRALILNTTVTTVDFSSCDLGEDGGVAVAACLARNATIQNLSLSGNFLGPRTAEGLAVWLSKPACSLETLSLSCNELGDEGASALAAPLKDNSVLTFLNLRANQISDIGAMSLLEAIDPSVNTSLLTLWINMNPLSAEVANAVNVMMVQKCPPPPENPKKRKKGKGGKK